MRGRSNALGPFCLYFAAMRRIIPSVGFLFELSLISREIFHVLKY